MSEISHNISDNGIPYNIFNDLMGKIEKEIREMKTVNIIVAGKTGVGKSTLINSVFRGNMADTGVGAPVTRTIKKFTKADIPIVLYDTPGFELNSSQQEEVLRDIELTIKDCQGKGSEHHIHLIWYCVNTLSSRFEENEIQWITRLSELSSTTGVSVIIVLTQSINMDKSRELEVHIEKLNLNIANVVSVLAQPFPIDVNTSIPARGLQKLVQVTAQVIPASAQRAFANAQQIDIEAKVKVAQRWANAFMATSFATGFSPIPFSDAFILVPMQVSMLAGITASFGLSIEKGVISGIVSSLIGSGGASFLGKFIVSNLLKFIPGAGTIAGGAISATTASLLTAALGRTYIAILKRIAKGEITKEAILKKEALEKLHFEFNQELQTGNKDI